LSDPIPLQCLLTLIEKMKTKQTQ